MKRIGSVNYGNEIDGKLVWKHDNQLRGRDGKEGHPGRSDQLKVLLNILEDEDASERKEIDTEANPDSAILDARLPYSTSLLPTQQPPPTTLKRSTRMRRPVQRYDPSFT